MLTILLPIWLLHAAALLSPGANTLLVSRLAAGDRTRSAVYAALGVAAGAAVWSTFAVLGVHAVFALFPSLRLGLQLTGGAYLLWLSSRLWRSHGSALQGRAEEVSDAAAFRMGLLTNITNPKSALFFGSVFAASFPAQPTPLLQASAAAMIVTNALVWHILLAWLFSRERIRLAYARQRRVADRLAAVVMGALGLRLLAGALASARG
jgi:threonine efflux protein